MTDIRRLDDCLSVRDGRLWIEEQDAVELVRRFGSPLFVVSEDQLRRNVRRFREAFARGWPDGPVKVMPAAKANWITAVQRVLASEGCGCDVYSAGELAVALKVGFEPQFISVNGVPKDDRHIRRSVEAGVRLTIDAEDELERIERAAAEAGKTAQVRLRLKPVLSGFIDASNFVPEGLVPTDIAAIAYKGGLSWNEIRAIVPRLRAAKHVELVGFHQHHGRHHPSTRYWEEQMRTYAAEIARTCELLGGYRPREIDIGGGFAIPRDPHNAATDYTAPAQLGALYALSRALQHLGSARRYAALAPLIDAVAMAPNDRPAPTIEAYAAACTATLRRELGRHGIPTAGVTLQLEPGRSIHGNAGIHLATVRALKSTERPIRWKIAALDTTEFWFTGGRYEHHLHDFRVANKADAPAVEKVDVVGRSCYGDRLMPTIRAPRLEVDDVFAFLDTGAYQEVSCSNFNAMPRPAAVLVTGAEAAVIRRRETEKDVFRRDEIPAHLRKGARR
ncbi:MAG: alanine racemase [Acidobacteria bacterium]|nr:alanine racemase [Acidobacteriota bacterium]